jgi:hypothetical protein
MTMTRPWFFSGFFYVFLCAIAVVYDFSLVANAILVSMPVCMLVGAYINPTTTIVASCAIGIFVIYERMSPSYWSPCLIRGDSVTLSNTDLHFEDYRCAITINALLVLGSQLVLALLSVVAHQVFQHKRTVQYLFIFAVAHFLFHDLIYHNVISFTAYNNAVYVHSEPLFRGGDTDNVAPLFWGFPIVMCLLCMGRLAVL